MLCIHAPFLFWLPILLPSLISTQLILKETNIESPCYKVQCTVGKECKVINTKPICMCNHNCIKSRLTDTICTKSGQTYKNLCELKKDECKKNKHILISQYGNCTAAKVECIDNQREKNLCRDWVKYGACKTHKSIMWKYCKKTCNYCEGGANENNGTPVEKHCSQTKYGCCKDSEQLAAQGPNNKGCFKGCRDGRQCGFFPHFCSDALNRDTMRRYCPYTCRYCVPTSPVDAVEIIDNKTLSDIAKLSGE